MGTPVFDRVGGAMRSKVGYNGSARILADIANVLLELEEQKLEERDYHDVSHFGLEGVG
jgi:nitrogenase molybdenum-iron protein alpha/beta subunit